MLGSNWRGSGIATSGCSGQDVDATCCGRYSWVGLGQRANAGPKTCKTRAIYKVEGRRRGSATVNAHQPASWCLLGALVIRSQPQRGSCNHGSQDSQKDPSLERQRQASQSNGRVGGHHVQPDACRCQGTQSRQLGQHAVCLHAFGSLVVPARFPPVATNS